MATPKDNDRRLSARFVLGTNKAYSACGSATASGSARGDGSRSSLAAGVARPAGPTTASGTAERTASISQRSAG